MTKNQHARNEALFSMAFDVNKIILQKPHTTSEALNLAKKIADDQNKSADQEFIIETFHDYMVQQSLRHVEEFSKGFQKYILGRKS